MEAASLSDAQAVVALWHVCGLTRPWNDPHADFRRAIDGPSSTVLVAREDGAVIASVMIGHDGHRGWVYYLAVSPDRRGQGLGAAAMRVAESWLSSHGIPKIQLMVREDNATATAFYHRLGYARQAVAVLGRFLES